jgi:hypothetical protein
MGSARIEGYRPGRVVVDGVEHTRDVIVLPERVVTNWWRRDGHSLVIDDLEDVLDRFTPYGQTTTSIIHSSPVSGRPLPLDG